MRGREVIQDVAVLLLQRRHHRHHAFDKARTRFALGTETALAPLHTRTDRALSRVVGRLYSLNLHEGPQSFAALENLAAGPLSLGPPTLATRFQKPLDLAAKRRHVGAKRRAGQGALAHPMPPRKHLVYLLKQGLANHLRGTTPASYRFKIPK